MLEISTHLAESVLSQFMEDGAVCPATLEKKVFATSAVAINHNPSATTTTASFHGTCRSVFHHAVSHHPPTLNRLNSKVNSQRQKLSAVSQKRTEI